MILAKYSVFDAHIALFMHEAKTGKPIYSIRYWRGDFIKPSFIRHSISYTRVQAYRLFSHFVAFLNCRYVVPNYKNYAK